MQVLDYVVFIAVVFATALIGLYVSFFRKKKKISTGRQYLFGDGKMQGIPLGLSWYSSLITAPLILSIPTEIYFFGTQYVMGNIGFVICIPFLYFVIVPVFCGPLVMKSPFEYYELRFNGKIRFLASLIHMIHAMFFLPLVLFGSVLSFTELTQIPLTAVSTIVGVICIFYTIFGGFPGVIWTDIFQTIIMGLSFLIMLIILSNLYSISEIWKRAELGGRIIFFNMDPSPFVRITFWNSLISNLFINTALLSSNGNAIQRLISAADQKQAIISVIICNVTKTLTMWILCSIGIFMYGHYYKCDPVKNKDIQFPSKLVPYFISDIMSRIPGFTGLFIGGLLCAGLSTLSSELNTTAGTLYYDILGKIFTKLKSATDRQQRNFMMILVFLIGIVTLIVAPMFQHFHHLTPLIMLTIGVGSGSFLGLLLLGIMFPWANAKGALCGTIVSAAIMSWITIGTLMYNNDEKHELPTSTELCPENNMTKYQMTTSTVTTTKTFSDNTEPFILYRISLLYTCALTTIILLIVGMITSYFTGFTDTTKLNSQLIMPCLRKYTNELPVRIQTTENE